MTEASSLGWLLGSVDGSGGSCDWRRLDSGVGMLDSLSSGAAELGALEVEPGGDEDRQEQQEERQILHRVIAPRDVA